MDRRKSNNLKDTALIIGLGISFLGLIFNHYSSTKQSQFAESQAINTSNKERQSSNNMINTKIALLQKEQTDINVVLQKLDNSDDANTKSIDIIKDKLTIFPTKEEVGNARVRQSNIVKTDLLNINNQVLSLNKRVSYIEGSLQYFFMHYNRLSPPNFYNYPNQNTEGHQTINKD